MRAGFVLVMVALAAAAFGNAYDHAFLYDSDHAIARNPAVRDLANLPAYFADPGTFSVLRANVDYRPVLQVSYALNYAVSGYAMWSWHLVQVLLHLACALSIGQVGARILKTMPLRRRYEYRLGPALAAALFLVHPTASGVVCYLSARSSLLAAFFTLRALLAYMRPIEDPVYQRPARATAGWYALALLTKVEAVGALAAFFMWDVWQRAEPAAGGERPGFFAALREAADRRTLRRLGPALAVAAGYLAVRGVVMAPYAEAGVRAAAGVGPADYLATQLTAWWRYVGLWFAPVGLVADHAAFPVRRSFFDPAVVLALSAWLLFAGTLIARWPRRPWEAFLAVSGLALISPTSSVVPLAEMVNELRPYLPVGLLSLVWVLPASRYLTGSLDRRVAAAGLAGVLVGLTGLTVRRNRVFATPRAYWADVVAKAPSARAHNNLALALRAAGDADGAAAHLREAVARAPRWSIGMINLALELERGGDLAGAAALFDRAVAAGDASGVARVWRGEFRLRRGEIGPAGEDFEAARGASLERLRVRRGLARVAAWRGDAAACAAHFAAMVEGDREWARYQVAGILEGFFASPARAGAGLEFLAGVAGYYPGAWWVEENRAALARLAAAPAASDPAQVGRLGGDADPRGPRQPGRERR